MKHMHKMMLPVLLALALILALLPVTAQAAGPLALVSAVVTPNGHVELTFNKAMAALPGGAAGFDVRGGDGQSKGVQSASLAPLNHTKIWLTLTTQIRGGDEPHFSYTPGTVRAGDGEALAAISYLAITNPLPHPAMDATPLPTGTVGAPYSYTFTATGGTPPYYYGKYYGTLPGGLTLSNDGKLSGTPTTAGTYGGPLELRIFVQDANLAINIRDITIVINESSGGAEPPATATGTVSGVTASGASLSGNVTGDSVTERGFVYGTSANPAIGGAGVAQVAAGSGMGSFTAAITGLAASTTYHVRAYAVSSAGTAYGSDVSFTTLSAPPGEPDTPTVATGVVENITDSGVSLSGNVTGDGVTERGFVYGTSANPAVGGAGVTKITAGSGTGSFTAAITGLDAGTTYHARAYAINSAGTAYGADVDFTTDGLDDVPKTGDSSGSLTAAGIAGLGLLAAGSLLLALKRKA